MTIKVGKQAEPFDKMGLCRSVRC